MSSPVPRTFPGRGVDMCRICQTPTRDHQIGPCPTLGMDLIMSAAPLGKKGDGMCVWCGGPARRRKNGEGFILYCSKKCRQQYHYKQNYYRV